MILEVLPRQTLNSLEVFVKPRIPKWIPLFVAAMLMTACSSDTSVLGPASDKTQVAPVIAPSRSHAEDDSQDAPMPPQETKRGRYAMAAS
jgi:hypothetical protein